MLEEVDLAEEIDLSNFDKMNENEKRSILQDLTKKIRKNQKNDLLKLMGKLKDKVYSSEEYVDLKFSEIQEIWFHLNLLDYMLESQT